MRALTAQEDANRGTTCSATGPSLRRSWIDYCMTPWTLNIRGNSEKLETGLVLAGEAEA